MAISTLSISVLKAYRTNLEHFLGSRVWRHVAILSYRAYQFAGLVLTEQAARSYPMSKSNLGCNLFDCRVLVDQAHYALKELLVL